MARVAVAGGSITGLFTALTLARDGHDVVVYERDPAPPQGDVLDWERPGTPQLKHSHVLLGRAVAALRADAPDLYALLRDAGAHEQRSYDFIPPTIEDRAPRPGGERLRSLSLRRPVFDRTLHDYAVASGVRLDRTGVAGLTTAEGTPPRVTGVALADGRTEPADAVVDATGRRSRVPKWLGVAFAESATECGNRYYTRYYELASGEPCPPFQRGFSAGGESDAMATILFRGDGPTFSISHQTEDRDDALRALADPRAFDAVARLTPWAAPLLAPGVSRPLNDPVVMAGQQNRLRRAVVGGAPVAAGLLLAGDAIATSNPTFGRGVSLALASAGMVRDALRASADPAEQVLALDATVLREIEPFVRSSQEVDGRTIARWRERLYGTPAPPPPEGLTYENAMVGAMRDRAAFEVFMSMSHLFTTPDEALAHPAVRAAAESARADSWQPPVPPGVPTRDEILAAATAATA